MFSLHLEIAYVNTTNNENTPPIQGALYLNLQSITLKRFKHAYEETRNELQTKVKQYNFFSLFSLSMFSMKTNEIKKWEMNFIFSIVVFEKLQNTQPSWTAAKLILFIVHTA